MSENCYPIFHGNRISLAINSEFNFYSSDSEEKFVANKVKLGKSWKYYDSLGDLTYQYDEYGFRNRNSLQEIQDKPYIVTIGCSHTMGTGIYYEDTYSCRLEQLAGIPVYNMGLCASSNEVSFFNLVWLLTNFRPPKIIVFQKTGMERFPVITENSMTNFNGPWTPNLRDFMVLSDDIEYNKTKFIMIESMLTQLAKKHDVNLYIIPRNIKTMPAFNDIGRDFLHGGLEFNEFLANYIWSNISSM